MLVLTSVSLAAAAADPVAGVSVSAVDVATNTAVLNESKQWIPGSKTLKRISALGNATLVVGFLNTLSGVFYSSDDDWIEEIEITVFTPYMAHIIKQGYNKMVDESPPFKGGEVVRAKSKVEYSCESLKTINWDELEGVTVEVSKDAGGESGDARQVTNPEEFKEKISKNTNGELKK